MEIMAIHVHFGVFEPARYKLVGVLPRFWVPANGVDIDICGGVGRDAVATDCAFLAAEVGDGEGCGWVQPKGLFYDAVEEWQVVRVSQKLRDAPFHGCGEAVTAAHNQVLGRHNREQSEVTVSIVGSQMLLGFREDRNIFLF